MNNQDSPLKGIAYAAGVSSESIESLIHGEVSPGIANVLGRQTATLTAFLEGEAIEGIAGLLGPGIRLETAQALRNAVGKAGAIGILIGLMLAKKS